MKGMVVALLILLAAALVGWWRMPDSVSRITPTAPSVAAPATSVHAAMATSAQVASGVRLTPDGSAAPAGGTSTPAALPVGPWKAVAPKLKAMAKAGDGRAAYRLAQIYKLCSDWEPISQEALQQRYEEGVALVRETRPNAEVLDLDQWLARVERQRGTANELCAPLGGIPAGDSDARYIRYLQMAAEAGYAKGMVRYAANLVRLFPKLQDPDKPGQTAALAHLDDIAGYQREAIGYLRQAVAMGEPDALLEMGRQYNFGALFSRDLVRAYAYLWAYSQLGAAPAPLNLPTATWLMPQIWARMSASQRQRARQLARQIFSNFVADHDTGDAA